MFGCGEPARREATAEQRVAGPYDGQHALVGEVLDAHFRGTAVDDAEFQVGDAFAQRRDVHVALPEEAQPHPRGLAGHPGEERGPVHGGEGVVGQHGEGARKGGQVHLCAGEEEGAGPFHDRADLTLYGERVRGGHHDPAGPDQDRVAEGLADPAEGPAHGGLGQVHAGRRPGHARLLQEDVQGDEEIQIQPGLRHAHSSLAQLALESRSAPTLR